MRWTGGYSMCGSNPPPLHTKTTALPLPHIRHHVQVEATFAKDMLRGDDCYEIRLKLLASSPEVYPFKDE